MRDEDEDRLYQCHRAALNGEIDRLAAALGPALRRLLDWLASLGRAAAADRVLSRGSPPR